LGKSVPNRKLRRRKKGKRRVREEEKKKEGGNVYDCGEGTDGRREISFAWEDIGQEGS